MHPINIVDVNIQFEHGIKVYNFCKCNILEAKMDAWVMLCNKSIKLNINMTNSVPKSEQAKNELETNSKEQC